MKKIMTIMLALVMMVSMLAGCSQGQEQAENTSEPASEENVETTTENASEESEASVATDDKVMDLETFKTLFNDQAYLIVDTRPTYAFNGWALENEARGGHVVSSTVFSASWLSKLESDEAIQAELDRYAISKDKTIVTYGYSVETAKLVADALTGLGYENVKVLDAEFSEVAADESIELASMAHYDYLVHPKWVKENMDNEDVLVYEASWGPGDKYREAHIPNAAHINTDDFEEGPLWNRKSDEEIEKSLLSNGITSDKTVVLYGEDITAASRIALILKYAGVEDVRLLDGGLMAWKDAGYDLAKGGVEVTPVEAFGVTVPQKPEYIIDMDEATQLLDKEDGRLVSIRSWAEYIGETSGYDYIEAAGRIDGAVYGYAGSDPWHMEDYRTPDNTMVNYEYMADRWAKSDISMDTVNSFYCGTGWRASETWFYAHAMGWENVSVYDGGWKEWSETEGSPVATGEPASN
ncbi:sulfurtransferase [Fusibacter sp. JL216-2]|uniref:sulfurtransferase n=1 Tax=Fusibacter sp. JL216-2 TaxID=3071453 RepID=UPI003D3256FF